jgi:hypothetical protein
MYKIAAFVGGVLIMAGVAVAGTMTSLDSTNSPTLGTTPPPTTSSVRRDDPGREQQARGRENEPGEDVRGPCDEAEHANDPRCLGATATTPRVEDDDRAEDDHRVEDDHRGDRSGPNRGSDGGGESGHGRHGRDD